MLLAADYPGSLHVRDVGLQAADDATIWSYCAQHGLAIVSKDSDFQHRAMLHGSPPKVIWIRLGNCPTASVAALLKSRQGDVMAFAADPDGSFLILT